MNSGQKSEPEFIQNNLINWHSTFDHVQFPFNFKFPFNFNSIEWNLNKNWTKIEQICAEIERKLNGNWQRTMLCNSVQGAWPVHAIIYNPGALNRSSMSVLNFHSISVQIMLIFVRFLFNFHWNSIELNWNWMEIEQDRKKQLRWVEQLLQFFGSGFSLIIWKNNNSKIGRGRGARFLFCVINLFLMRVFLTRFARQKNKFLEIKNSY